MKSHTSFPDNAVVLIATAGLEPFLSTQLRHLFEIAADKRHTLTENPEEADLIFFTDISSDDYQLPLRTHPYVRKYPDKCYAYFEQDGPLIFLPGIYDNATRSLFNLKRVRTYCFLARHTALANHFVRGAEQRDKDLFFSFMGTDSCLLRTRLFKMNFHRDDVLVRDTSAHVQWRMERSDERQKEYAEICRRSRFVLCLRGSGPNLGRIYEAMEMGLVPVIISDPIVLPEGPNWKEFTIFVREKNLAQLSEILIPYEGSRVLMGQRARQAWEEYFAPEKQFNYLVDSMIKIGRARLIDERFVHLGWPLEILRGMIRPYYLRLVGRITRLRAKFLG